MLTTETPQITGSAASSTAYNLGQMPLQQAVGNNSLQVDRRAFQQAVRAFQQAVGNQAQALIPAKQCTTLVEQQMSQRRLVQVFIADPDESVPLDQSMLYQGEQKFTDLTDQELFFEIDIAGVLKEHNRVRVNITNKKIKERIEKLEPARIRDLKMVVVTVASF